MMMKNILNSGGTIQNDPLKSRKFSKETSAAEFRYS